MNCGKCENRSAPCSCFDSKATLCCPNAGNLEKRHTQTATLRPHAAGRDPGCSLLAETAPTSTPFFCFDVVATTLAEPDSATQRLHDATTPRRNDSTTQLLHDATTPRRNDSATQRLHDATTPRRNDSAM